MYIIKNESDIRMQAEVDAKSLAVRLKNSDVLSSSYWSYFSKLEELVVLCDSGITEGQLSAFLNKITDAIIILTVGFIDSSCIKRNLFGKFFNLRELCLIGNGKVSHEAVEKFSSQQFARSKSFKFEQYLGDFWNESYDRDKWQRFCDK